MKDKKFIIVLFALLVMALVYLNFNNIQLNSKIKILANNFQLDSVSLNYESKFEGMNIWDVSNLTKTVFDSIAIEVNNNKYFLFWYINRLNCYQCYTFHSEHIKKIGNIINLVGITDSNIALLKTDFPNIIFLNKEKYHINYDGDFLLMFVSHSGIIHNLTLSNKSNYEKNKVFYQIINRFTKK